MKYNDLEVFILTYNRADYLKTQLESVCKQTAEGFKIKILNNASTDNTLEVIASIQKKYPQREIEVITHPTNIGNQENFKSSQQLTRAKYCAVFHDDDCIHPTYIETAMKCLYKHPEVVMIGSNGDAMYNVTDQNWHQQSRNYFLFEPNKFAFLNLSGFRHNFATMIYRADIYKAAQIKNELCGKIWDLPFIFDIGSTAPSILLEGQYIRYRLSAGQDSKDFKTGPFPKQIVQALLVCKKAIQKYPAYSLLLLYYFAKALYAEQKLQEIQQCSWDDFMKLGKEMGLWSAKDLFLIKWFGKRKIIKCVQKLVERKRKNSRHCI